MNIHAIEVPMGQSIDDAARSAMARLANNIEAGDAVVFEFSGIACTVQRFDTVTSVADRFHAACELRETWTANKRRDDWVRRAREMVSDFSAPQADPSDLTQRLTLLYEEAANGRSGQI